MRRWTILCLVAAACMLVAGCGKTEPPVTSVTTPTSAGFALTSPAFAAGAAIPKKYDYDSGCVSPPLAWSAVPAAAKELALIVVDPDAHDFKHWVVYKIPTTATGLDEGLGEKTTLANPAGAIQGKNEVDGIGYLGCDPPAGETHHYHFHLYALDAPLAAGEGLNAEQLQAAMKGHIVAETGLVATYKRD